MPEKVDLAEILRQNPQIDPDQLRESMELAEELARRGVTPRGYELAPPFGGRRVRAGDENAEDPRTVHLKRT